MIKLSDYVANRLVDYGIRHVFMISGGGAMHLNDSIGKADGLEYICNQHEQASAIAAEGYARISGELAVVVVTTGPGGTNTITGVIGQWLDSVPVLYISGQVKNETTISSCPEIGLRQLGDQEINIIDIVKPVTKFAAMVKDPKDIRMLMEKAIDIATSGRPGPVWFDIPLDVQGAIVNEDSLEGYCKENQETKHQQLEDDVQNLVDMIKEAKRPVLLAGHGIRIAKAQNDLLNLIERLNIPVVSTFNGCDLIPSEHPLYVGRLGTIGDRAGNFAVQNSDLLLCIGTRNNIRQISYNFKAFARVAKKVAVDVDKKELNKPTISYDLAINADAKDFLQSFMNAVSKFEAPNWNEWLEWCTDKKRRYPVVLDSYYKIKELINPYVFVETMSDVIKENQIVVTGNGTASVAYFQACKVKKGQRTLWNSGCASMGYDLPAAIGACFAADRQSVICLAGDGSLQMNIQELQTLAYHQLPVKVFVFNNRGYFSIKQTQDNFFQSRYIASGPTSGVGIPNFIKIAEAYGIKAKRIYSQNNLAKEIQEIIEEDGPVVCEVMLTSDYQFSPKLSSQKLPDGRMVSKPLEDMYPFLNREEFSANMIIPVWKVDK